MSPKVERSTTLPLAVPIKASGNYLGNDGNWSTFEITAGTSNPPQVFDVLISLSSLGAWLALPLGCPSPSGDNNIPVNCAKLRGAVGSGDGWSGNSSSSITFHGDAYPLLNANFDIQALDPSPFPSGNLTAGSSLSTDQIQLNIDTVSSGTLTAQLILIYGIADFSFFVDTIGVGYGTTKLASGNDRSLLTVLANSSQIASNSVGYTAGAYYSKLAC
jgi:hypothetical protein